MIGRIAGRWMMKTFPRIVKKEYLDKTHHFFQKYGGKTIIIARFLPIVRKYADGMDMWFAILNATSSTGFNSITIFCPSINCGLNWK